MAYRILVDGELIFDPVEDNSVVSSASISQSINAAAYLDFTVSPECVLPINEGESQVEVRWESQTLFYGRVTDVSEDTDGWKDVSCVSDVDLLNNVLVRPYSSDGSSGNKAPATMAEYFSWLVQQYNQGGVGGKRIDIDVNQGNQIVDGEVSFSSSDYPSVANELENNILSYGGYLDYIPYANGGTLNLYSDLHDVNAQIIDFGENITSITIKRDSSSQHNAIIPHGKNADNEDIDLSSASEQELKLITNAGYMINGDAFYSPDYTDKYGYREIRYDVGTVENVSEMIRYAIAHLRTLLAPQLTIECKAVDMALYNDNYQHLRTGQAARVRAEVRGVDEYLAVNDMQLDLTDPAQTIYTFGISYDTLTGNQSALLSKLNGEINGALDKVQDVVDGIGNVVNDVDVEYYVSDSPDEPVGGEWGVGTVTAVDNKYVFSHLKKQSADGTVAISDPTLLTTQVRHSLQLHRDLGDEVVWVSYVAANYDVTDDAAGIVRLYGQMGGWEAEEQGAVTVAFGFQDSAYQAAGDGESLAGVGVVTEKSSDIDLGRADIVSYVDNGRVGVYVRLTGKVLVNLYADGKGFSTPFVELTSEPSGTKVFDLADAQTTYESAILQADNALRAYVEATYATKAGVGESIAQLDMRADQIQTSVEQKMDAEVANTTFVNKSTFDQTVNGITTTVSETVQTANEAYTKASQVEQTVDGLEIGLINTTSRNLALGTGDTLSYTASSYTYFLPIKTPENSSYGIERIHAGGVFTLSFDWKATGVKTSFNLNPSLKYTSDSYQSVTLISGERPTVPVGSSSGHCSISFKPTSGQMQYGEGWLIAGKPSGSNTDAEIEITNFMLVEGEREREWSPAPEDVADAAKTATNYLKFDSSGLCIGNQTSGTLGYNALITSSQYQIRNGGTVLSAYGTSKIELGKNSSTSTVSMCGGKASFGYKAMYNGAYGPVNVPYMIGTDDSGAFIGATTSTDTQTGMNTAFAFFDGKNQIATIAGAAGTYIGASKVNNGQVKIFSSSIQVGVNGVPIRGIYYGSIVIGGTGTSPLLFTSSQYASIVGRPYREGDVVVAMNGDYRANQTRVCGTFYNGSTGNIGITFVTSNPGQFRVNYLIIAAQN